MASSEEIEERIKTFTRELCVELGDVNASDGDCWLDAVENQSIAISDAIARALVTQRVADRQPVEEEAACEACGQTGRYLGSRPREIITRRGSTTIAEPEYFCPCCRKAFFPDDPRDRG